MATQNTASKPLNEESEEEKRKRAAAEDYLKNRDAFRATLKPGYTVDMTGEDTSKMSDDQIKAEANRRIGETKTNFQSAFSAARDAGFGSDPNKAAQAAQDYLNKGQARIVGDTLVGSAAGISASEWDKRDKSVASGNNPPLPKPELIEIAPGVSADAATAQRTTANARYQDAMAKGMVPSTNPTGPNYAKANEAIQRMVDTKRDRETKGGVAFEQGRKDWGQWRQNLDNDRRLAQQSQREMAAANREFADANLARRSIVKELRSGGVVSPDLIAKANERLYQADRARGFGALNTEEQGYAFEDKIREREGLPLNNPSLRRRRFNPYSVGSGPMISSRTPGGVGG